MCNAHCTLRARPHPPLPSVSKANSLTSSLCGLDLYHNAHEQSIDGIGVGRHAYVVGLPREHAILSGLKVQPPAASPPSPALQRAQRVPSPPAPRHHLWSMRSLGLPLKLPMPSRYAFASLLHGVRAAGFRRPLGAGALCLPPEGRARRRGAAQRCHQVPPALRPVMPRPRPALGEPQ